MPIIMPISKFVLDIGCGNG